MEHQINILVVDDEETIRRVLHDYLQMEGYHVETAEDGVAALKILEQHRVDIVLTDLKMPNMGGIELLSQLNRNRHKIVTIVMTGYGTVETAIEAMKNNAYDYILKPFKMEDLIRTIQKAREKQQLIAENIELKETLDMYEISQNINSAENLEKLYSLCLNFVISDLQADLATIHIENLTHDTFEQKMVQFEKQLVNELIVPDIDIPRVVQDLKTNQRVLFHGTSVNQFFQIAPRTKRVVSFMSIPLKGRQEKLLGFINAYSFSQGSFFEESQWKMLMNIASRSAIVIENMNLYENLKKTFKETIKGFAIALEDKDIYTQGHSERVALYSRLIALGLKLPEEEVDRIYTAALLHDIGKMGLHSKHLNKNDKLTFEEFEKFKSHPLIGKKILEPLSFLSEILPGVIYHHERWDGTGYPSQRAGEAIPLVARILAVADSYDAMTTSRPYRKSLSHEIAFEELQKNSGTQFDPQIVTVFVREIEIYRQQNNLQTEIRQG